MAMGVPWVVDTSRTLAGSTAKFSGRALIGGFVPPWELQVARKEETAVLSANKSKQRSRGHPNGTYVVPFIKSKKSKL